MGAAIAVPTNAELVHPSCCEAMLSAGAVAAVAADTLADVDMALCLPRKLCGSVRHQLEEIFLLRNHLRLGSDSGLELKFKLVNG